MATKQAPENRKTAKKRTGQTTRRTPARRRVKGIRTSNKHLSAEGKRQVVDKVIEQLRAMQPREVVLRAIRHSHNLSESVAEELYRTGHLEFKRGGFSAAQMDYLLQKNVMEVLQNQEATAGTKMQAARLARQLETSGDDADQNFDDKVRLWCDYADQCVTIEQLDDLLERVHDPAFEINAISPEAIDSMMEKTGSGKKKARK